MFYQHHAFLTEAEACQYAEAWIASDEDAASYTITPAYGGRGFNVTFFEADGYEIGTF